MSDWPELNVERDHETLALLHLAAQMLGKIRVAHAPWINHGWHVALQPERARPRDPADGGERRPHLHPDARPLPPRDRAVGQRRRARGVAAQCRQHRRAAPAADRHARPARPAVDFQRHAERDRRMRCPSPRTRRRATTTAIPPSGFREALAAMLPVFDAVPRRLHRQGEPGAFLVGQLRPGGDPLLGPRRRRRIRAAMPGLPDRITREAYSHEVSSAGFWAGGVDRRPSRSSTATPIPSRTAIARRRSRTAGSTRRCGEFVLPYAEVRAAADPDAMLSEFLQSTYDAAADLANGTAPRSSGSRSRPRRATNG